jgi:ribonuclease PH
MRLNERKNTEIRSIEIIPNIIPNAVGSCMFSFGNTKVICTASINEKVPHFLKGTGSGWVSAEYGMLPKSTNVRVERESVKGKQTGRTQEIQRLVGRSIRSVFDLKKLGEKQIKLDCDVINADGGTRTAAINGSFVAVSILIKKMLESGMLSVNPIVENVGAVSCGIVNNEVVIDLDYLEDTNAECDGNFVITESGKLVEVQISAEKKTFNNQELIDMLEITKKSIYDIIQIQKNILENL